MVGYSSIHVVIAIGMSLMKAYWQTLVEALTLRRVIALPIMFSTVTVAMHLAPFLAREVNRPMLLGAPPWAFGVMSLLGLLCIFVIIYANRLRVSLLPSITLSCEPERGGLVQTRVAQIARDGQVLAQTLMATSIRVAVRAVTRIAPKNATAFVTKFEKLDTTGTWMASRYSELVQLPWVGETMTVDLSNLFPRFVSVLHIGDDNKIGFWMIGTPFTLVDFFETATKYRLTIVVLAEGRTEPIVTTDQIVIELDWKGKWDTVTVRPV